MITFIRRDFRSAVFLILVAVLLTIAAIAAYLTRPPLCPTECVTREEAWNVRNAFLPHVVEAVPGIVESQDRDTGRFGNGVWLVTKQNVMLTLAAAWATESKANPYYHDPAILDAIMLAGDALVAEQDANGRWPFRNLDGTSNGQVFMPWTYSRWVRTFAVVRDAMPADRRRAWEKALLRGFDGIAAEVRVSPVSQNIPAHHAMALYVAGQVLGRPEWSEQAAKFLGNVAAAQDSSGFWSEHVGPVVNYNFVYVDALGTYYAMSHDEQVRQALARASRFHANFTYPDGSYVETVDERNPYDLNWFKLPNVGFTFTAEGRGFVREQLRRKQQGKQPVDPDLAASFVLYAQSGEVEASAAERPDARFVLGENKAVVRREGPWFACLSAYHAPVVQSRWIQDRQNFLSLYHDKTGLILGGGNTKLQPLWSTFTVGDVSLLSHRRGDTNPIFIPPAGLIHVPSRAELDPDSLSLKLNYGEAQCRVDVKFLSPSRAEVTYALDRLVGKPVVAHVPLLPKMGSGWRTASGKEGVIGDKAFTLKAGEAGSWFEHNGWRVMLPATASVVWPVLPHQPYSPGGQAGTGEGRIVVSVPLGERHLSHEIVIDLNK